jgi:hypothetical protein
LRLVLATALLLATLAAAGQPRVHAAEPFRPAVRDPIVPGIRPAPRMPAPPRILTQPSPLPAPKRIAPGGIGLGRPGIVRPVTPGPNCRSSCGSRCQMVSCSGLSVSQCASVRQRCRASCTSGCNY